MKASLPARTRAIVGKEGNIIIETVSAVSESITVISADGITITAADDGNASAVGLCWTAIRKVILRNAHNLKLVLKNS